MNFQVLESVWLIFKSNMNLAFNIVTVLLSLLFSSGTYLLNAGFSTVSHKLFSNQQNFLAFHRAAQFDEGDSSYMKYYLSS